MIRIRDRYLSTEVWKQILRFASAYGLDLTELVHSNNSKASRLTGIPRITYLKCIKQFVLDLHLGNERAVRLPELSQEIDDANLRKQLSAQRGRARYYPQSKLGRLLSYLESRMNRFSELISALKVVMDPQTRVQFFPGEESE